MGNLVTSNFTLWLEVLHGACDVEYPERPSFPQRSKNSYIPASISKTLIECLLCALPRNERHRCLWSKGNRNNIITGICCVSGC